MAAAATAARLSERPSASDSALSSYYRPRSNSWNNHRGRGRGRGRSRGQSRGYGRSNDRHSSDRLSEWPRRQRGRGNRGWFAIRRRRVEMEGRESKIKRKRDRQSRGSSTRRNSNISGDRHRTYGHASLTDDHTRSMISCFHCGRIGHIRRNCPFIDRNPVCFKCGKHSHSSFECDSEACRRCVSSRHWILNCRVTEKESAKCRLGCVHCGSLSAHDSANCPRIRKESDVSDSTRVGLTHGRAESEEGAARALRWIPELGNHRVSDENVESDSLPARLGCVNCGASSGHTHSDCPEPRMDMGLIRKGMLKRDRSETGVCRFCLTTFHRGSLCPLLLLPH